MVISFLSLPNEAMRHIFLALGSPTLTLALPNEGTLLEETCHERQYLHLEPSPAGRDALSLASCSSRLNTIYRASVRTLSLRRSYDEEECARLWSRFPAVAALEFDLRDDDQGFAFHVLRDRNPEPVWRGMPSVYPTGLVRTGIKSIKLQHGAMHVLEMQAMLRNCDGLNTLELSAFGLVFDHRDAFSGTNEMCSFGLERHAPSLEKLTFDRSFIQVPPVSEDGNSVDHRWLNLSSLSALKELAIIESHPGSGRRWSRDVFYQLSALTNLASLSLMCLNVDDQALAVFLPSLSQLSSLDLHGCENLSSSVLHWLPAKMDRLNLSATKIFDHGVPRHMEGFLFTAANGTKSAKTLVATRLDYPRFGRFCSFFAGASIENLALSWSKVYATDLSAFLSRTPNLLKLCLFAVKGSDESVFRTISKLARLRRLILNRTDTSDKHLALVANGPCRYALRHIDLASCPLIQDVEGARRLFSEGCAVYWSSDQDSCTGERLYPYEYSPDYEFQSEGMS